jgi:tetratricopeptide (TPR) repeat protein
MQKQTSNPQSPSVKINLLNLSIFLPYRQNLRLFLFFWSIVAFLYYGNTLSNEYALDDVNVITSNPTTQKGFAGLMEIFTQPSLPAQNGIRARGYYAPYYRPLTLATFAIEYALYGLRPGRSHALNVLLYAAILGVLHALLAKHFFRAQPGLAFGAVLLFAAHPIHTEVVANLKSRDELLSVLGGTAFLWAIFESLQVRSVRSLSLYYSVAAFSILFALLSKENAVYFGFFLPLSLYFFTPLKGREILLKSAPWLGLILAFLLLRGLFIGISPPILESSPLFDRFYGVSANEKYATLIYLTAKYWIWLLFPYPLCADYTFGHFPYFRLIDLETALALVLLISLAFYSLLKIKRRCPIAFGLLWAGAALLLVSNWIIDLGGAVGERFLFLPSIGSCIALAIALERARAWLQIKKFPYLNGAYLLFIIFMLGSTLSLVWQRNKEWKNNASLFLADIRKSPHNVSLNHAAGAIYYTFAQKAGAAPSALYYLDSAAYYFGRAIALYPNYALGHADLGRTYFQQKKWAEAETHLRRALALDSSLHLAWFNLGNLYAKSKKYSQAIFALQKAVKLQPKASNYRYNLALTYLWAERLMEAEQAFEELLRDEPFHAQARAAYLKTLYAQADTLAKKSDSLGALQRLEKAAALNPIVLEPQLKLARLAIECQKYELAQKTYARILELDPQNQEAKQRLYSLKSLNFSR